MKLIDHPTVRAARARGLPEREPPALESAWLRELCLEAGADDVGFVDIERPEVSVDREQILEALPGARTLIAIVLRMNKDSVRSPARSVANLEFHATGEDTDHVARRIVRALEARGLRAINPAMSFPMEMQRFPGKAWIVSHKNIAVAAGLGAIGIHRNVIHPKFGNFILLGTIVVAAPLAEDSESRPIDYNPCLECRLCVAACPVGAIDKSGAFDFSACYTHNYREFMSGFTDWVETVADSRSARDYRRRVSDQESASMWQSLAYKPNYKAAYCMAVCPAGEDVIGPWLANKPGFTKQVVRPLQRKEEPLYVVKGSDAEAFARRRFPHKQLRHVHNGLRPQSAAGFVRSMPLVFQSARAEGLEATLHFRFSGREPLDATARVSGGALEVEEGLHGEADLEVSVDGDLWVQIATGERSPMLSVLMGRLKLRGDRSLLPRFAACFPS